MYSKLIYNNIDVNKILRNELQEYTIKTIYRLPIQNNRTI